ncbi:MAG: hypothetical protein PF483_12095 [Halothiobacillus sp.]|jgi:hypothetical protein|nr:hypothetical protein [Halothiobacillus sp.]
MMDAQNQSGRWFNGHDGRTSLLTNVDIQTGENLTKPNIQTAGKVRVKCQ